MEKYLVKSDCKTSSDNKYAFYIGRWQPFHEGHQWLINQKLNEGQKVCIAIRDVEQDETNWWSSQEIQEMLENRFKNEISKGLIKVVQIPDIESINIGRGVGYDIIEHIPPTEVKEISATKIRRKIGNKDGLKDNLDI
jgi:cytidyltransferase-like protein